MFANTERNPVARNYQPHYRHEVVYLTSQGEPAPMRYDPGRDHKLTGSGS